MEGRGSLRQLHQQLAGSNGFAPLENPYANASMQDWQMGGGGGGYEKQQRPPPPLPSLPPWAGNASLSNSSVEPHHARHPPLQQQQQQQHRIDLPLGRIPSSSSRMQNTSHSREEIDPATSSPPFDAHQADRQGPGSLSSVGGWRKAPSYFGSMKRLPFTGGNNGQEHPPTPPVDRHPQYQYRCHQLSGLLMTDQRSEGELWPPSKQDQQAPQEPSDEPEQQSRSWRRPPQRNQQQEAEEDGERAVSTAVSDAPCGMYLDRSSVATHEMQPAAPAIDQTAALTNQAEEDSQPQRQGEDDLPPAEVVQQSGFFRPWKKPPLNDDSADSRSNNLTSSGVFDGGGDAQTNKWKERALLNPFARRGKPAKSNFSTPFTTMINGSESSGSSTKDEQQQQSPLPPVAPQRPITPVPAPSAILASARPLSHGGSRSRGAVSNGEPVSHVTDAEIDTESAALEGRSLSKPFRRPVKVSTQPQDGHPHSQQQQQQAVPANYYNREEREDFQSFKAPAAKNHKTAQPAPRGPKPQPQAQAAPPRESKQPSAKLVKPKGAVLNALAEIQRKRDERRAQQAEEKQRIQSELEEHGDDTGYKFRRLIQKYRDALPAFQRLQRAPTELPPISSTAAATSVVGGGAAAVSASRLSVFVRKRPLSKKELKAKGYDIVSCLYVLAAAQSKGAPKQPAVLSDGTTRRQELILHEPKLKVDCSESLENHTFRFDGVFDELQDNAHVYSCSVGPLIPFLIHDRLLDTRSGSHANLTVFAYGQTGSGKTYTMKSIYRQAASDLFERIEACCGTGKPVLVGVSFYEIYMNNVNDLLNGRCRLQLMEDGEGTVQLLGLKEVMIASADELLELVKHGEDSRATSANAVHDDSSRSHALLRITLYPNSSATSSVILARLSMVDLAGSERACDTQSDKYVSSTRPTCLSVCLVVVDASR